jgi:voltage-gated potassium channel
MAVLALTVIPALLLDDGAATPRTHLIATAVNWVVWLTFCGEFVLRVTIAPDRRAFIRRSWFELVIIAVSPPFGVPETLQGLRAVRAVRFLRLFRFVRAMAVLSIGVRATRRALRHHRLHYVLALTGGVMLLGASGLYVIERDQNEGLTSFGDALWWAVSRTTTVGYGDIFPRTGEGRLIAVILMLTGIGVIGVFTATIASFFMIEDDENRSADVERRLTSIEAKLDQMLAERASEGGRRG